MWECQPRAHAVLLRPSQLPAVIAIVAFTFLAGFVWVSSPRGSGEGWISVLLLAYPAVGVYMLLAAWPGRLRQTLTQNFAVIERGWGPRPYTTLMCLYYAGGLAAPNPSTCTFTRLQPHVLDPGGVDGASFVGLSNSTDVLLHARGAKQRLERVGVAALAPSPVSHTTAPDLSSSAALQHPRSSPRFVLTASLCAVAVACAMVAAVVSWALGFMLFMVGYCCVVIANHRGVNVDCLWVTPSGLNLTVERGRGVVQTAPWQDVFPLSIMGDTPRLPLCRGFLCARQPADARVVHFHKIGAVAELTTTGLQHLLTLALEFAEAQGAPVGDSYESTWAAAPPQHLSALERLLEEPQVPTPWSHYERHQTWDAIATWVGGAAISATMIVLTILADRERFA